MMSAAALESLPPQRVHGAWGSCSAATRRSVSTWTCKQAAKLGLVHFAMLWGAPRGLECCDHVEAHGDG